MERISIDQMPEVSNENLIHLQRYIKFINSRPERKLYQKGFHTHHIYPKSIAKRNEIENYDGDWNLIGLTTREHFIAHMILWKCYGEEMTIAFWLMSNFNNKILGLSSRQYSSLKEDFSKIKKNTICINNGLIDKFIDKNDKIPDGYTIGSHYTMSDELKIKNSKRVTESMWITNGKSNKRINKFDNLPNNFFLGKTEIKKCNRDHSSGKEWFTNGVINKYIRIGETIPDGYYKGFVCTKNKRYDYGIKRIAINNGIENKFVLEKNLSQYANWNLGRINVVYKNKEKKIWINNGKEQKMIPLSNLIPMGWKKGMIKR